MLPNVECKKKKFTWILSTWNQGICSFGSLQTIHIYPIYILFILYISHHIYSIFFHSNWLPQLSGYKRNVAKEHHAKHAALREFWGGIRLIRFLITKIPNSINKIPKKNFQQIYFSLRRIKKAYSLIWTLPSSKTVNLNILILIFRILTNIWTFTLILNLLVSIHRFWESAKFKNKFDQDKKKLHFLEKLVPYSNLNEVTYFRKEVF